MNLYRKIPFLVLLAILGLMIYIAGAGIIIKILHDKQLYAKWLWQGTIFLAFLAVIAGLSWINRIKSPIKFITYSMSTSLIIFGVTIVISFGLPHDYMREEVYSFPYDASIPVTIISLVGIVVSLCLNLGWLAFLMYRRKFTINK
jgi:hypothetical protein